MPPRLFGVGILAPTGTVLDRLVLTHVQACGKCMRIIMKKRNITMSTADKDKKHDAKQEASML